MKLTEVALSSIEKLLSSYNITNYTIREDGLVDVDGDVAFFEKIFTKFPIKFGKVSGNFRCSECPNLTSLAGAPLEVGGFFSCYGCVKLTSLKGAPQKVGGDFSCSECPNLTSLEGAPLEVGGDFNCYGCNKLTSLAGAPLEVGGFFSCYGCVKLTSLKGAPQKVGGFFSCSECPNLTSLDYLPKKINGLLSIGELPKVKIYLVIFNTKGIIEIEHENKKLVNILNKYLKSRDMLNCQDELIEAGLEQYAEID